jgi:hypothetical protein
VSKQLDLSDPSKLSQDDLNYALQRYLITEEQATEAGWKNPGEEGFDPNSTSVGSGMGPGKDPADFKVSEVKAYLDTLDTENSEEDADEFDRVISEERDGEGRKSLLALAE